MIPSIHPTFSAILLLIATSSAKVINVPTDSTTIQSAINGAIDGDTVLVHPGTYVENINFNGKNIVVGSLFLTTRDTSYISQTVIDGNQSGSVVKFENDEDSTATLTGFTIANGNGDGFNNGGGGVFIYRSDPILDHLTIKNNAAYWGGGLYIVNSTEIKLSNLQITSNGAVDMGGGIFIDNARPQILNTEIHGNTANSGGAGIYIGHWSGVESAGSLTRIENCIFWNNNSLQINYPSGEGPLVGDVLVGNSTFYLGSEDLVLNHSSTLIIYNSIIWNESQTPGSIVSTVGTVSVDFSIVSAEHQGEGNIDFNPLFVSPEYGDFHLLPFSSAIGAGTDSIQTAIGWFRAPSIDISGNPRPNPEGSNPDLGAYELDMAIPLQGPTLDAIADMTVFEDSALVFFVSGNDLLSMPLTYSVFGHDSIGITVRKDTVILESNHDFFSLNPIPLYAQACNTYICGPVDTFNIVILPVNDSPSATLDLSIVSDLETSVITLTGSPGPPNESGQLLTYMLMSLPDNGTLTLSADGTPIENAELPLMLPSDQVFFQPPAMRFLRTNFQYQVIDNGGTENGGVDTSDHHLVNLDLEVSELFSLSTIGSIEGGITLIDNSTIYAPASGDKVYRFDNTGIIEYTLSVNGDIKSSTTITPDHTVYIASTDNNLYSFNANGVSNPNWPIALGAQATASVAMDADRNVYIGTQNGIFQAISSTGEILWSYNVGAAVFSSAAISIDNTLYITNHNGRLLAFDLNSLDPTNPQYLWGLEIAGNVTSSPALDDSGHIYLTAMDGRLVKILDNGTTGEIVWEFDSGSPIESSPVLDSEYTVYFGCDNGIVYAVDITGNLKWEHTTNGPVKSTAALAEAINTLYIGSSDGHLYAIDLANGAIIWKYDAQSDIIAPTIFNSGIVYTGTVDGQILAITATAWDATLAKEMNVQRIWPTFQRDNARTGYQGTVGLSVATNINQIPSELALHQNYPNAFNPTTTIRYELPEPAEVRLVVYNLLGREVVRLVDSRLEPGYHTAIWHGRDATGRPVPSGLYIARLVTQKYTKSIKMVLLK